MSSLLPSLAVVVETPDSSLVLDRRHAEPGLTVVSSPGARRESLTSGNEQARITMLSPYSIFIKSLGYGLRFFGSFRRV
jgi:hypothetical protein